MENLGPMPLSMAAMHYRPRAQYNIAKGYYTMESANDMKAHTKTYGSFIDMLKWTVPLLVAITAVVVVLIAS